MKKKILFAVLALVAVSSCTRAFVKKDRSDMAEERRSLTGFERIELLGSLDVKYHQADSFSVMVKAPKSVIDLVETRVEGNKLVARIKGSGRAINLRMADGDDVTVYVTSPDFLGIELKGSGDFDCHGLLDTDTLDVAVQGSGDVEFGRIVCDRLNVSLTGSGDVQANQVTAQQTEIELVGSGDVELAFDKSGTVVSQLVGSGDIELRGDIRELKQQKRGSGDINTKRLVVRK